MAQIIQRTTSGGETRYDVRTRIRGRVVTRTFKRRRDADRYATTIEADKLRRVVVDPRSGHVALEVYAKSWIATRLVKGKPLAALTVRGYEALLRRNILPAFGSTFLGDISVEAVRTWHAGLVEQHGSDAAAKSYRLLRAILNTAVSDDKILRNPCRVGGAGTEHRAERPMLDTATVLELADAIGERFRSLVLVAGFGGLRTGEMLGLCRRHVDLLHSRLEVRQQAQEVTGRGRIVTPPKSEAGNRTVALPAFVVEELVAHLDRFSQPGPDGLVFTGPTGGPLYRSQLSIAWGGALEMIGLEGVRVHDLRHHAATLTARKPGVTTRELMARIGHSSPRAALLYQHATDERDREIAAFIDAHVAAIERPVGARVVGLGGNPAGDARAMDARWRTRGQAGRAVENRANQVRQLEAAGGIEPPYEALQAPESGPPQSVRIYFSW